MSFVCHPNLASKIFLIDLPLCRVFLEDESHYPWLILVPRRGNMEKIMDLSLEDQWNLMKELNLAQTIIWEEFIPTQINVAALGNKTPQLHAHVIGRFSKDPAWPLTVWDHPERKPYEESEKKALIEKLVKGFLGRSNCL